MRLRTLIILVAVLLSLIFVNISKLNESKNKDITLSIGNEKIILDYDAEDTIINLDSFTSEFDTIIKESYLWHSIKVNGEKIRGRKNLGKLNITGDATLEIEVEYVDGEKKEYTINLLPSTFPKYTVNGESKYDGDYYTSTYTFNNHYIFKLNEVGDILFYKRTDLLSFDFQKQVNKDGEIRYLYLESVDVTFDGATNIVPCNLVVLDENYNEIDRVKYLISEGKELKLENHGYLYLDDNHYILVAYEGITDIVDGQEFNVFNCVIQEIKNGKVVWEFNAKNHKALYDYTTYSNLNYAEKYQDYAHFNSMNIDVQDGNLLCSFRGLDAILKISRKDGSLMWILGGIGDEFKLTEEQKTSKQHSATSLKGNKLLIYDNGVKNQRSRIVEYTLDEKNKIIKDFKEYDTDIFAYMMGSVKQLDDTVYLLCYGGGNYEKSSIQEINVKTGEVYFEFTFNNSKAIYNVNKYK